MVSILHFSYSYETVAAILHPSSPTSSLPVDVDDLKHLSSSVDHGDTDGHIHNQEEPMGASLCLGEQEAEEYPGSAEPYMYHLSEGRSESLSEDECWLVEGDGFSMMKKWPPLTEHDLYEITKEEEFSVAEEMEEEVFSVGLPSQTKDQTQTSEQEAESAPKKILEQSIPTLPVDTQKDQTKWMLPEQG